MKSILLSCIALFVFIFGSNILYAQDSISLKGKIIDKSSNETIPYANIYDSIHNIFATTDSDGFFELRLIPGNYSLLFSMVGYETISKEINLSQNNTLKIELRPDIHLQEVIVTTEKLSKTAEVNSSGITTITNTSVERLPAFLGEKDILKAVLLTPGIQSGQEGARGIFVRGGSPDQNLMLFHNAPVYNVFPAHWDPKLRIPRGQVVAAASIVSPKY